MKFMGKIKDSGVIVKIDGQTEKQVLKALDKYALGGERIAPKPDVNSKCAYSYEDFSCECGENDELKLDILEELADRGFLKRIIHDRIFHCSSCGSWHVNLREVCPSCSSLDWKQKRLYHHFSCGYVGLEDEFKQHSYAELHCPKCEQVMRHIGLDYEKPTQSFFCYSCEHIFDEHNSEGKCIECASVNSVDDLKIKEVYAYELTTKCHQAIEKSSLKATSISDVVQNEETGLLNYDYLAYAFDRERMLAQELNEELTICLVKGETAMEFKDYSRKYLKPSCLLTEFQSVFIALATRGKYDKQNSSFQSLYKDFQNVRENNLACSIFKVDLEIPAQKQLEYFIQENEKDFSKNEGICVH